MKLFDKTWKLAVSGAVIGLLVMLLAIYGNPANMAICVACFIRDTAGALKLHTAAPVQYFRPEVVGFVCGSFLLALLTKEYKSTAGSSPMVRFILGAAMMIGALVFLGCPLRMVLRMAAGDLNAWVVLIGFAGGCGDRLVLPQEGFSPAVRMRPSRSAPFCRCAGGAARNRRGDQRLRGQHRGPGQQACADHPFLWSLRSSSVRSRRRAHVLCGQHPRHHSDEEFRPDQHYRGSVCSDGSLQCGNRAPSTSVFPVSRSRIRTCGTFLYVCCRLWWLCWLAAARCVRLIPLAGQARLTARSLSRYVDRRHLHNFGLGRRGCQGGTETSLQSQVWRQPGKSP